MKHAIINRIVAVIALAAVIAALVFFGLWRQVESQRAEQQKQLDQTFAMQFSQLYENLFCTEQVEKVRQESLGQAAVCEAVFNATSYRDNTALGEVMRNLYDLARQEDTTLLQKIEQEDELVEKLGVKRTIINQAAGKMVREGLLVVDGYTDKITHYRKPTEKERLELERRAEQQQKPSVIQDCKRSEIMKRILFIYGAGEELPVI